jgi:chromosome segregation ATPase
MIRHILIAPMFVGATVLSAQTPQPPSSSTRPASIEDLVIEVRGLRADIQQMADSSIRAQLLVARLQVQEQRIAGIAKQLADTEEQIRALDGARNPFLEQMLKNFEQSAPTDPGAAEMLAGVKGQLEKIQNGDPVLKERQATLSRLLTEEQTRWSAFNSQLEALEQHVAAAKSR